MNAETGAAAEEAGSTALIYGFTFGHYTQPGPWTDRRQLTWPQLVETLTTHEIGAKAGTCIVPALFRRTNRKKDDADRIDVAFLDSDTGLTLAEIIDRVGRRGWAAIVSSSHSHLTNRTRVKRGDWDSFRAANPDAETAAASFLERKKGYLARVAAGGRVLEQDSQYVHFEHGPCPKFRVVVPLLRPWLASNYDSQKEANAAWKRGVDALAAALNLFHDQSCTDTSRLFYLPRRPADGPDPETAVLEGGPCDLFGLPAAPPRPRRRPSSTRAKAKKPGLFGDGIDLEELVYEDPTTQIRHDLRGWARDYAGRFEIAKALHARKPDVFVGKLAGCKHHTRCANEAAHTEAGIDVATIVINASESEIASGFVIHCRHDHCDGEDRLYFLKLMLEHGWLAVGDLTDPQFLHGAAPPKRPLIRVTAGKLAGIVDQAEQALLHAKLNMYQRGPFIVRPGWVRVTIDRQQEISAQRILEVQDHAMVEAMTLAADWEKFDGRINDWVTIDAPTKVGNTYRQRVGRWRLPVLTGLVNAPTLRADGSILTAPGYDARTGLILDTHGVKFPDVPKQPTQWDAIEAMAVLDVLISTFPFVDRPSRSVALSAILTACIRRSLPAAPMHAFTAPIAGSGKSMLVDLASLIATGREAGVIAQGKTEEELEKRLGALLLGGDHVIAIDNCEAPLGGEFLCSMLTQRTVRARILGRSEAPELPSNACVTATGNNLVLLGDMTRRALLCQLDPRHERPELRTFAVNPIKTVQADRPRFVTAALTVLLAYDVAGRPNPPDPLGSFEDWSGWVRGALLWVGQADPVDTLEEMRELDPRLDALKAVMTQWKAVIGEDPVSVRHLIEKATEQRASGSVGVFAPARPEFAHAEFREALLAIAGDGGAVNGRRLGKWLSAHQSRIVDGLRIARAGLYEGVQRWRLERAQS